MTNSVSDRRFYDFCDELGLYVCDEANLETHGFRILGQPTAYLSNLPEWEPAMLERCAKWIFCITRYL
jgi:beta-galactosidase/beta-glucuronidase